MRHIVWLLQLIVGSYTPDQEELVDVLVEALASKMIPALRHKVLNTMRTLFTRSLNLKYRRE